MLLEALLLPNTKENLTTSSKLNSNFLETLLKDSPKDLLNLFKSLKLNIKDIKDIINKNIKDEKLKEDFFKLLSSPEIKKFFDKNLLIDSDSKHKIPDQINSKTNPKEKKTEKTKEIEKDIITLKKLLKQDVKEPSKKISSSTQKEEENIKIINEIISHQIEVPKETEKEVFKIVKKIITSKEVLKQVTLKEKDIKSLKETKNLKELIETVNKLGLNLKKITLQKIDTPKQNTTISTLNTQIPHQIIKEAFKEKIKTEKDINTISKFSIDKLSKETSKKILKENNENIVTIAELINKEKHNINSKKKALTSTSSDKTTDKTKETLTTPTPNIINELKANQVLAKESVKQFSSKLHEAIQDYKPPISRLSLELHPKELGKVEVTITHRGDNINVQVHSNNVAVNFLHSQQDTLKQALVNLGYSEVNMSFNSNQKDQRNKDTYKQNQKLFKENDEDELVIEIPIYA